MRRIYADASGVLVWLGPQNLQIVDAMKVLDESLATKILDIHVAVNERKILELCKGREEAQSMIENADIVRRIHLILRMISSIDFG